MSDHGGQAASEVAVLAGGCFWCLEAVFDELEGVESVESGYTGGHVANPTYEAVCSELTGHAEAVRITFDPTRIRYEDLLDVFFDIHDPTTLNRQGPADIGTQYRSAIFYLTPQQRVAAEQAIAALTAQGAFPDSIVTEITEAGPFYQAEPYHDDYFRRNPNQGYCRVVIAPKVAKFRKHFGNRLKPSVTV
ncbi:MAG: peptide-methionine (S)-S-oxide reductase MsrA [Dehalococcoidia bacterium]